MPWRRDQSREPLLLIHVPITPTREEAIETVREILSRSTGKLNTDLSVEIIDALTRVREPEMPPVGSVYRSKRNRTGRRWEVWRHEGRVVCLWPIGSDNHNTAGGVKAIRVPMERLADARYWECLPYVRLPS